MIPILLIVALVAGVATLLVWQNARTAGTPLMINRLGRFGLTSASQVVPVSATAAPRQSPVSRSVERVVGQGRRAQRTALRLEQADMRVTAAEYMTFAATAVVIAALSGLLVRGILGLIVGLIVGVMGPRIYVNRRITKRTRAFLEQLPDMAQMMGNSLRAGFSIIQSMELVARDAPAPASQEFTHVVSEVKLGLPLDLALDHLLLRMPSEDLGLMVVAINVQRQIGGNLAEILEVIAQTVRERVRIQRDLRTLTAQARLSSYIITALPVAVAALITVIDPAYESYLYTATLGRVLLGVAVVLLLLGFFVLSKLAKIEM